MSGEAASEVRRRLFTRLLHACPLKARGLLEGYGISTRINLLT